MNRRLIYTTKTPSTGKAGTVALTALLIAGALVAAYIVIKHHKNNPTNEEIQNVTEHG